MLEWPSVNGTLLSQNLPLYPALHWQVQSHFPTAPFLQPSAAAHTETENVGSMREDMNSRGQSLIFVIESNSV